MWLNPMVRVLCPGDMRPRSRDMGPQLRDMITWFRDMRSCMCAVHSWASMRSAAPGWYRGSHGHSRLGETGSVSPKIRRHAKRGWRKNVHHHHTLPRYCCCCSGLMLLCALFCSVKLYPLVDITSRRLFLFWDLGFRTWTDRHHHVCFYI
jgi:hypothetical protein